MKPPHSSTSSSPSPTSMFPPKPSVYPGHPGQHSSSGSLPHPLPPPQHLGMYMSYPHPSHPSHVSSPALGPHIAPPHTQIHPQLHALSSRGTVPRASVPHQGSLSLGNVAAASTPPLQVSPPLHSQAHLGGLHSPHHQHQQLSGHSLGMSRSPAITQVRLSEQLLLSVHVVVLFPVLLIDRVTCHVDQTSKCCIQTLPDTIFTHLSIFWLKWRWTVKSVVIVSDWDSIFRRGAMFSRLLNGFKKRF